MGQEIERKYLVSKDKWNAIAKPVGVECIQSYLLSEPRKNVRVRILGKRGFLTIKGKAKGITRKEFEYEIPIGEAKELMSLFGGNKIEKTRYYIEFKGKEWEVDVFCGDNEGLIIAEIELTNENETFAIPEWVEEEVTHDTKYMNSNLQSMPFKSW